MKTLPIASICLSLVLGGGLVWVLMHAQKEVANGTITEAITKAGTQPQLKKTAAATLQSVPMTELNSFRWSQLDSKDYHLYVRNLRGIGCPEATLHAIVSADVHAAYHQRIQSVEQQLAELGNAPWSLQTEALVTKEALQAELQKMPDEEVAKIADLLGYKPEPRHSEVTAAQTDAPTRRQKQSPPPAMMPLVMQEVDLKELNLNPGQIQVLNEVRQNFLDEIGGLNQDANDPAYYQRWLKAQPEADDTLRGMLGSTFFQNYQLAAGGNNDK